jgi:Tol biopolymer transport system component
MLRRLVLACVATTIVLASVPALSSATSIAGPNGKIAFTSGRDAAGLAAGNMNDQGARIWVADWPSGTPIQATTIPSGEKVRHRQPNWSPDHTRIAYAANPGSGNYGIWILDLRTESQTEFVAPAPETDRPTWSPDGTKIAYGSMGDLWVKGVAPGSVAVQLTNTAGIIEERPVWSPDGNTLYYSRGATAETQDLYRKTPVTAAGEEKLIIGTAENEWQPSLSPDGKTLCYTRGPKSSAADTYLIPVTGGLEVPFATNALGNINCVWSPDGKSIIYTLGTFGAGDLAEKDAATGVSSSVPASWKIAEHFDGNSDWATNFSPKCDDRSASVGVNSFVSIPLACTDPDSGFGKAPPTPDPLSENSMEIASQPKHGTIGSISDDEKVIYTPNKDFKGTDSFTYTGEDDRSTSQPATVTIQVTSPSGGSGTADKTPPSISDLRVSVKKWRLGKGLASISKAPVGTTVSFKLSEAAKATVSFQRSVPGKNGGKPHYVNAGSLKPLSAKAGKNKVRFQGRLTRSRSLALGKYRVVVSARDAAGNQSKARTGPNFTIVAE